MVDGLPRACRLFCRLGEHRCQWSIRHPKHWERKHEFSRDSPDQILMSSRQFQDYIFRIGHVKREVLYFFLRKYLCASRSASGAIFFYIFCRKLDNFRSCSDVVRSFRESCLKSKERVSSHETCQYRLYTPIALKPWLTVSRAPVRSNF